MLRLNRILKIKITTPSRLYSQEHPFIQSVKGAALSCFSYYGKEIVINTCISPWALEGVWTEKGAARGVQTRAEAAEGSCYSKRIRMPRSTQEYKSKVNTKERKWTVSTREGQWERQTRVRRYGFHLLQLLINRSQRGRRLHGLGKVKQLHILCLWEEASCRLSPRWLLLVSFQVNFSLFCGVRHFGLKGLARNAGLRKNVCRFPWAETTPFLRCFVLTGTFFFFFF